MSNAPAVLSIKNSRLFHTLQTCTLQEAIRIKIQNTATLIKNTTTKIKGVSITAKFSLYFSRVVRTCRCSGSSACKLQSLKQRNEQTKPTAFALNIPELQYVIRQKCQYFHHLFTLQNSNSVVVHIHSRDTII